MSVTLIIGAAGGIGTALSRQLAARGHKLVLADAGTNVYGEGHDAEPVERLAKTLPGTVYQATDVRGDGALEGLVDFAYASFGELHSAVYLAGFRHERSVVRTRPSDLRRVLAVHLEAPLALMKACAQRWTELRQSGSLVIGTGPSAFFGVAGQAALSAAGAGVVAAVRSAAVELHRKNIRVNAVAPTARTRLTEHLPLFQGVGDGSLSVEPVARLIGHLLSDDAADVSGEILGAAGERLYALQSRETAGTFVEAEGSIAAEWDRIVRG
ncbi:MAG: SDR family oxidoreductase [Myxococcota bacterium]